MSDDGELLVVDALETQRRFAYLGRPLVRAGEPSEYLPSLRAGRDGGHNSTERSAPSVPRSASACCALEFVAKPKI